MSKSSERKGLFFGLLILVFCVASVCGQRCPPRPVAGSVVANPYSLTSADGLLGATLTIHNYLDFEQVEYYCYNYQNIAEAPTLQVNPGDRIQLTLRNQINANGTSGVGSLQASADPCQGVMTSASTNLHFHGLNLPAICHQDEVVFTLLNPGDPPFQYDVRIPPDEPPGLYWYHPHPHGITLGQLVGGASGAIIVNGIENIKPQVTGLKQQVLVIRDSPSGGIDPDSGPVTINFVPAQLPIGPFPVIQLGPSEKQFWRAVNATADKFLALQLCFNQQPQSLELIALDGTPVNTETLRTIITIPPAGRAEFIVTGSPDGETGDLISLAVNTGASGDPNPHMLLALVEGSAPTLPPPPVQNTVIADNLRFSDLVNTPPKTNRQLYFSEDLSDQNDPKFYITVKGQTPKEFEPNDPPAIITTQGAVEDWIIENRSTEIHAFHIHQLHFALLEKNGAALQTPPILDTVQVDPWDGVSSTYPRVKVRMDFRYRESVGTFVYHCHLIDHEDAGMMAKIQVNPSH